MKHKYAILTLLGLAVAVAGLALLRLAPASIETPLPYVMLGIGTGVFGWGAGELLKRRAVEGDVDNGTMMAGQSAALVCERATAAEAIARMMAEAEALGALDLAATASANARRERAGR